jgi:hypothetical protein
MKPANHFRVELPEVLSELAVKFPRIERVRRNFRAPWSTENILAETILVADGNANESIDT